MWYWLSRSLDTRYQERNTDVRIHESLITFISNHCRVGSRVLGRVQEGTHVTVAISITAGRPLCFPLLGTQLQSPSLWFMKFSLQGCFSRLRSHLSAPFVSSGPVEDVRADTSKVCEWEGTQSQYRRGRGTAGEGVTRKTGRGRKPACASTLTLFYF